MGISHSHHHSSTQAKVHAKCLRPSEYVRQYFRDYRARKASGSEPRSSKRGNKRRASQSDTEDEDGEEGLSHRPDLEQLHRYGDGVATLRVTSANPFKAASSNPSGPSPYFNTSSSCRDLNQSFRGANFGLSESDRARSASFPYQRSLSQRSSQPIVSPFSIKVANAPGLLNLGLPNFAAATADGSFNAKRGSSESGPWCGSLTALAAPGGGAAATASNLYENSQYYEEGPPSHNHGPNPTIHQEATLRARSRIICDSNDAPLVASPWSVTAALSGQPALRTRNTVDLDKMSSSERSGSTSAEAGGAGPDSSGRSREQAPNGLQGPFASISNPFASAAGTSQRSDAPLPHSSHSTLISEGITPSIIANAAASAAHNIRMRQLQHEEDLRVREQEASLAALRIQSNSNNHSAQNRSNLFKSFALPPMSAFAAASMAASEELARSSSLPASNAHQMMMSPSSGDKGLLSLYQQFQASPAPIIPAPLCGHVMQMLNPSADVDRKAKQIRHSFSCAADADDMAWVNQLTHLVEEVEDEDVLIHGLNDPMQQKEWHA